MTSTGSRTELDLVRLSGSIGAEIRGLDLTTGLAKETIAAIRDALVTHKVIFFRNQHTLDGDAQERFARRFATPTTAYPTALPTLEGEPAVLDLDYGHTLLRADFWHTDVTYTQRPPLGCVLRAVALPPYGGDTVWANTHAAYQSMPPELRTLADSLWAVHANTRDTTPTLPTDDSDEAQALRDRFTSTLFKTEHPLVRVHPETGERALLLGRFVRHFVGWSPEASHDVLRVLESYIHVPENCVRWRWSPGDVAFWDNRATQHYAVRDYGAHDRRMQRISLAGDTPVSVSGAPSRAVTGDDTDFCTSLAKPGDGGP
ncbi:hypothetical protein GCM10010211_82600 [Streptomyces albospinus]|uniref:TauD/TfdA-like domain-containing protein n=1 Tax=Streptomyces albospinus TaxID=285515 RepID=A0ABQ2VPF2_9ACTN|nr:TauD/TfdA family dioxygenase [Streptomyces albospinus]GGV02809.1 hypothetical protein GCM10010211_82600 [Streptomyces albospinus]